MDDVWKVVAAAGMALTVVSLGRATVRSFQPRDLVPRNNLYSLGLTLAIYVSVAFLFGIQPRGVVFPFAVSVGAVGGYATSLKEYAPILVLGAAGGAVIGWMVGQSGR